jgi:hypothetical protein
MTMTRIAQSVEVNAPVEAVFAFASDWRYWEKWWLGVSGFKPATEVTRGNGARYAYKAWVAGLSIEIETEIQDFVENVGWRGTVTKGLPHRAQWVFEAKDDTTRFTYILEYSLRIPVLGALLDSLLVQPGWRRLLKRSLRNLQLHFE